MRRDYQVLIGREFSVGEHIYTVSAIEWLEDEALVDARDGDGTRHLFPVRDVIQHLLVEEEIVLFNPNWLSAVGP